jgi:hypothetical protein
MILGREYSRVLYGPKKTWSVVMKEFRFIHKHITTYQYNTLISTEAIIVEIKTRDVDM